MSLAGFDPSAGAGLLADIKTAEALGAYGLGVCTALTIQTEDRFISIEWQSSQQIIAQLKPLLESYPVRYCKIGIIQNARTLLEVIRAMKEHQPGLRIILDPVLKASAGYMFHDTTQLMLWKEVLQEIYLLTPNYHEALLLSGKDNGHDAAVTLAAHCAVLLKGGHRTGRLGMDSLFFDAATILDIPAGRDTVFQKHGSGCVLSAAITAQLAAGSSLAAACITAKHYTEKFLASHSSLLGYHFI